MDDNSAWDKLWDPRDQELNLREKLAQLIAIKTSGVPDALPEKQDYELADYFAQMINNRLGPGSELDTVFG